MLHEKTAMKKVRNPDFGSVMKAIDEWNDARYDLAAAKNRFDDSAIALKKAIVDAGEYDLLQVNTRNLQRRLKGK
jgi:hypothetical protein